MALHAELTGASLHVPGYSGSSDPGAVGAGKYWVDTSAGAGAWVLKVRNAADDGWESVGSSTVARGTVTITTASLANDATEAGSVTGGKSGIALVVATSAAAWVRLYTTAAARDADASRLVTEDPVPGAGVLLDVLTSGGALTQPLTPPLVLFNNNGTPSTALYYRITNKSGSTAAITATITRIPLES